MKTFFIMDFKKLKRKEIIKNIKEGKINSLFFQIILLIIKLRKD
jgi:hypothetical protein